MNLEIQLQTGIKIVGNFVFATRTKMGIGKKKFGQLCDGLSETYIRNLEAGAANITLKSLVKLKFGMNSTIPTLITGDSRTFSNKTLKIARNEDFTAAKQNFSTRLFALMKNRKLNSISFSNYLGMDESATNKYLNGSENPTYLMLLRFAYVLNVEVVDFFDYGGALPENTKYKPRYINP
ncbi:MAG TPA: helix-turn-helix transcriptional regulator [Niabella sp.]|nr:helix-turn-helix transcriptional regulator [Niabella sp.]